MCVHISGFISVFLYFWNVSEALILFFHETIEPGGGGGGWVHLNKPKNIPQIAQPYLTAEFIQPCEENSSSFQSDEEFSLFVLYKTWKKEMQGGR